MEDNGANEFTLEELDALFTEETQPTTPAAKTEENVETPPADGDEVSKTKAFANRLKESTEKARKEERESIAKNMGFDSYDALVKSKQNKILEDKGLDPDTVAPIVEELVKSRLNDDPRMKELEEFRKKQVEEFGKKELAEITTLTGGEITKLNQLPKEVIEKWKSTGSLKAAYLELEGEKLITKIRSDQSKGNTNHLQNPSGKITNDTTVRPLTSEEKKAWKSFYPNITEEELNKKTVSI